MIVCGREKRHRTSAGFVAARTSAKVTWRRSVGRRGERVRRSERGRVAASRGAPRREAVAERERGGDRHEDEARGRAGHEAEGEPRAAHRLLDGRRGKDRRRGAGHRA